MRTNRGPNSTPARPTRVCRKCGVEKTRDDNFPRKVRNAGRWVGWGSYCHPCQRWFRRRSNGRVTPEAKARAYAARKHVYWTRPGVREARIAQGKADWQRFKIARREDVA